MTHAQSTDTLLAFVSDYATELFYLYGASDPMYQRVSKFLTELTGTQFKPTSRNS